MSNTQNKMGHIVGYDELSSYTGISQRTLARAVKIGLLPVTRINRKVIIFREEDVIVWFANRVKAHADGSDQ